jgi:outer membrane protein assembly factor BamB
MQISWPRLFVTLMRKALPLRACIVLSVLFFSAGGVAGEEWPMHRQNPSHTGVQENSRSTAIIPKELWSYEIPEGITFSSPVVSMGRVFIGSNFSSDCKAPGRIFAFDAATGALIWSVSVPGSIGDAAPAVIEETVIVGAGDTVYALFAATGQEIWTRSFPGFCFMENFVTVVPDLRLVFVGGILVAEQVGYVFSFMAATGQDWSAPYRIDPESAMSSVAFSAPTHVLPWGLLVLNSYNNSIYGLEDASEIIRRMNSRPTHGLHADSSHGVPHRLAIRWVNSKPTNGLYVTPAYDKEDAMFYTGSFDGSFYAVDLWGDYKWSFKTDGRVIASPAIIGTGADKRLIFGSEDGFVYALDRNGTLLWKFDAKAAVYSSIAVSGGGAGGKPYIYFANQKGDFYVLDVGGVLISSPDVPKALGGWLTWSSPAIADGRLYIASAGQPSRFFILGDNPLTEHILFTSGNLRSVDVGTFGDSMIASHAPGVNIWPAATQWGPPTLLEGRSVRKAVHAAPRFTMNLKAGSSDLTQAFRLTFTYLSNGYTNVYQYDGTRFRLLGKLPATAGFGTTSTSNFQTADVVTIPSFYSDYLRDASNDVNVLFCLSTKGSEFYLDNILMTR